jgi:hypothetical protein
VRHQLDEQHKRNELAQKAADERIDRDQLDNMVKAGYEHMDQPGLDPRNRPSDMLDLKEGERAPHKSIRDLEDITGNPGHRGVTPYAPATSMNAAPDPYGMPQSINEPPTIADENLPEGARGAQQPPWQLPEDARSRDGAPGRDPGRGPQGSQYPAGRETWDNDAEQRREHANAPRR